MLLKNWSTGPRLALKSDPTNPSFGEKRTAVLKSDPSHQSLGKINDRRKKAAVPRFQIRPKQPPSGKNERGKNTAKPRSHIRPKQSIYPLSILKKTCTFQYFSVPCNLLLPFPFQTYVLCSRGSSNELVNMERIKRKGRSPTQSKGS